MVSKKEPSWRVESKNHSLSSPKVIAKIACTTDFEGSTFERNVVEKESLYFRDQLDEKIMKTHDLKKLLKNENSRFLAQGSGTSSTLKKNVYLKIMIFRFNSPRRFRKHMT